MLKKKKKDRKCPGSSCNMTMFKEIIYMHRKIIVEENMPKC